ncbi:hypothetical protein [Amycolatopsis australiensis]|uniref:Uncharacterized protein n=1 Tax=Amycolatopsis australiensis TaxID=546364 RepID=A0A1K1T6T9_9PSEU|nr:hypothetical protein [Amycolatopsis australiensis]SFW92252.1 hypothetical protein SAMN04489730_8496 [Amycolatopsis australiensis]
MPETTPHDTDGVPVWRRDVGRRTILAAGGAALLLANLPGDTPLPALLAADATPDLTLDLLRREDMLKLRFEFFNLRRSTAAGPPKLVPIDASAQSVVVVGFDSQHLMEETTYVSDPGGAPPANLPAPGDIATRAAGPSRIAFLVPATVKELPFTEDGLLAWSSWVMRVVPKTAAPAVPGQLVTDLRLVDWLHLTPEQYASWAHVTHPVTSAGRTELWHTRLAPRDDFGRPDPLLGPAEIRATAADTPDDPRFDDLLSRPQTLTDIVTQSNTRGAVRGDLVLLSALGSSLELDGKWAEGTLTAWRHRSVLGRDNYVRIEERGFLFPYGHKATLITETERTIAGGAARLLRRQFVRVREPVKLFQDNGLPFRSVEIGMTTTPNLAAPGKREMIGTTSAFWVQYTLGDETTDIPFPIIATDWAGNRIDSVAHFAFVYEGDATDQTVLAALQAKADPNDFETVHPRRTHELGGQKVAFGPVPASAGLAADTPRNTTFPALRVHLNVKLRVQDGEAGFAPQMLAAEIRMPAVEALAGGRQLTTAIGYDPGYVAGSFENTKGELFARVSPTVADVGRLVQAITAQNPLPDVGAVTARFGNQVAQLGGIAAPDLDIRGLSRSLGPLSGPAGTISQIAKDGDFDPRKFFPGTAKLLGGLSLADLLGGTPKLPVANAPKIVTTPEYGNGPDRPPTAVTTILDWQPALPDDLTAGVFLPKLPDRPHATLSLHGENRTVLGANGVTTTSAIKGDLRDFAIELVKGNDDQLSFIRLTFRRFAFEQHDGAKPVIHVELDRIDFEGPLKFVNTLQQFLVSTGKGLGIDVQPAGITAGYTLAIPDVGIGVFALQHLAFSAALSIPFDGSPARARFAFCSREHPFTLTVSLFGGGGFFALALGTDGFELMEASIEFGGAVAFNLGVASGSVSVMAGIYFKLEHKPKQIGDGGTEIPEHDAITLTGYVRANGSLNVLGLITISAEFYLALSYTNDGGKNLVEGEASLTVEIDILFFSKSVTLTVHKSFAGPGSSALAARTAAALPSGGSPSFGDQMSQDDWNTYCDAFAA